MAVRVISVKSFHFLLGSSLRSGAAMDSNQGLVIVALHNSGDVRLACKASPHVKQQGLEDSSTTNLGSTCMTSLQHAKPSC